MCLFLRSCASRTRFTLDQTIDDFPCARHTCRHDEREIGPAGGKCALTTATDHSASTGQTTYLPKDGSTSSGAPRQDGPNLETGPFPCPGRRRYYAGIVSSSACSGSASQRYARENQGFRAASIALIKEMATNNRLWGAERICGELLKLEIRVSKRTIQKYMKQVHPRRARGQTWRIFLHNHADPGVGL